VRLGRRALVVIALALMGTAAVAFGLNTLRAWYGWSAVTYGPAELAAKLRPAFVVRRPPGAGPFPTALLFSGCDGPKDNLARWAQALADAGWASVAVDSHAPRGLDDAEQWRLVCAGQLLTGAERAADVAVALDDVRHMAGVDADRLALIGASHGGWAVLDFFALIAAGEPPPLLSAWPAGIARDGLTGVRAAVLFYPYCGELSRAARTGWRASVPVLFLLVAGDGIADEADCLELADRQRGAGTAVNITVFDGVTHGFDQVEKSALSTLAYDPEATAQALALALTFLEANARP
jgi:dienelactone hydrolase